MSLSSILTLSTSLVLIPYVVVHIQLCFSGEFVEDREVVCASDKIVVNLSFKRPFVGVVFIQNQYDQRECRWRGDGSHFLLIVVPLNGTTTSRNGTGEHSSTLIISDDPTILTEDSFALTVRCVFSNERDLLLTVGAASVAVDSAPPSFHIVRTQSVTVSGNSDIAPSLAMTIREGHDVEGRNLTEVAVGQRLTLDVALTDTSIFDIFVHSCLAHDGSHNAESTLPIINSSGCALKLLRAVDAPVLRSQGNSGKHLYVHIYGFQFTTSEMLHFECKVTPCVSLCRTKQCETNATVFRSGTSTPLQDYVLKSLVKVLPQRLVPMSVSPAQPLRMNNLNSITGEELSTCANVALTFLVVSLLVLSGGIVYGIVRQSPKSRGSEWWYFVSKYVRAK